MLFIADNRCCFPLHTLLADIVDSQGGTALLIKILNRFGVCSSIETLNRFIQYRVNQQSELEGLNPDGFMIISAEFLHSYARVFSGNQVSSTHATSIQAVQPLPSLSQGDNTGSDSEPTSPMSLSHSSPSHAQVCPPSLSQLPGNPPSLTQDGPPSLARPLGPLQDDPPSLARPLGPLQDGPPSPLGPQQDGPPSLARPLGPLQDDPPSLARPLGCPHSLAQDGPHSLQLGLSPPSLARSLIPLKRHLTSPEIPKLHPKSQRRLRTGREGQTRNIEQPIPIVQHFSLQDVSRPANPIKDKDLNDFKMSSDELISLLEINEDRVV